MFDFNGTLSDDEPLLFAILADLFAEQGRPLSEDVYYGQLAGLSDPEIVRSWLGADHPAVDTVLAERIARYRAQVADGSTISPAAREAVCHAAELVPVAVVSGAHRAEIVPALQAAGLGDAFSVVVAIEDVERGKPDPAGYLLALELLGGEIAPGDVTVFEDTEAGVASAKAAGMRCVAVPGTHTPERLALADELAPALDVEAVRRALAR
jgi:beta-phosphoglucomutase-like phosphatase (HAD superfamily)